MRKLFVGNWKMHHTNESAQAFCESFHRLMLDAQQTADIGIAPAFTAISTVARALSAYNIKVGAQNVHWLESGAHTGEVSSKMLLELGASFVILGHSERRQFYGETSEIVAKRALSAAQSGLQVIVCVGESESEYKAGGSLQVVKTQLGPVLCAFSGEADLVKRLVIAYEPVWAIGTGLSATRETAALVHDFIRGLLTETFKDHKPENIKILYGGSTKPENISELVSLKNVNGALVGGASLEAKMFFSLIQNGSK